VAAGIDGFAFRLSADARIVSVAIAGASGGLLILQYPCMASARGASPAAVGTRAMLFIYISPQILNIMAKVTLKVLLMTAGCVCLFYICALKRIFAAGWAIADDRACGLNRALRCFLDAVSDRSIRICILVHTIEVIKIAFAAVGTGPVIGMERHR